ncbi:hypothetical protein VTK73DRAFT_7811 [Phialemonium thermophilum]|uniref:Uncharacterized protein n=1 Tax=Phialemonium thermophilum TaxID=223376 RepID=A0ABR3WCB5_9PEZI
MQPPFSFPFTCALADAPTRFMIDGIDHDDAYRMVEDELLSVAGDFTRHLHAAEYQRLKALASSRNAETIRSISRPVTGHMTDLVRRRRAAVDLAVSRRRGIKKVGLKQKAASSADADADSDADDSDDTDDDLERAASRDTSLRGLLDSPRKKAVSLSAVVGPGRSDSVRWAGRIAPQTEQFGSRSVGRLAGQARDEGGDGDESLDQRRVTTTRHSAKTPGVVSEVSGRRASSEVRTDRKAPMMTRGRESAQVTTDKGRLTAEPSLSLAGNASSAEGNEEDEDDFLTRIRNRRARQRRRREATRDDDDGRKQDAARSLDAMPLF